MKAVIKSLAILLLPWNIICQTNWIDSLYGIKEYNKIIDTVTQSNLIESGNVAAYIYHTTANAAYEVGEYELAKSLSDTALDLRDNTEAGKTLASKILYDKAFSEYQLYEYITSYKTVKRAENIMSSLKNPDLDYLISIYCDLVDTAAGFGYYEEAKYFMSEAESTYSLYKDSLDSIISENASKRILLLYKKTILYSQLDNIAAIKTIEKTFTEFYKKGGFNRIEKLMYYSANNVIGDFYLEKHRSSNNETLLHDAKNAYYRTWNKLNKKLYPEIYIQTKFNLGKIHQVKGEINASRTLYLELLSEMNNQDHRLAFVYGQLGYISVAEKKYTNAVNYLHKMIASIHSGTNTLDTDMSQFIPNDNVNHTMLIIEQTDKIIKLNPSDKHLLKQLNEINRIGLIQFKNIYQIGDFNERLYKLYDICINHLLTNDEINDSELISLIENLENIENKYFWKRFSQKYKQDVASIIPDSLLEIENSLRKRLLDARLAKDTSEILKIEQRLRLTSEIVNNEYDKIATLTKNTLDITTLQQSLSPSKILLRYKKIENNYHLFSITNTNVRYFNLGDIENEINDHLDQIYNNTYDRKSSQRLLRKLIPFVLEEYNDLVIIPDETLARLPFEVLVDKDNKYLLESKNIYYSPYLKLLDNKKDTAFLSKYTLYAPTYNNQAPRINSATTEVKEIASTLGVNPKLNANKDNFIKNVLDSDLIHFSGHAYIYEEEPELSYLLLDDKNQENRLYLNEIYNLDLQAQLVVLSACNTAYSHKSIPKGHVSLQQGFRFAGVPSLCSSLWAIPDNTSKNLLTDFYKEMQKGHSISNGLTLSKRKFITENPVYYNRPYFWAGIVFSGKDMTLEFNTMRSYSAKLIFSCITMTLLGILLYFRKRKSKQ